MSAPEPLTIDEVARYARRACSALYSIGYPDAGAGPMRAAVGAALDQLNELLLLVDLCDAVATGLGTMVDEAES